MLKLLIGIYRISGIIRYPARNQVSGWIRYPVFGRKRYSVDRDIPDIRYPARNQVSGWIWYPVFGRKRYPVLSGILYPVESRIRHCRVHY